MAPVLSFARDSMRIWVGGFLLLAGLVPLSIGARALTAERDYRDDAQSAGAEVVGKALHPATSNTSTRYEITYRAVLPGLGRVERTQAVEVGHWEQLEAGSAVTIQYLPDDAASVRLARAPAIVSNTILLGIGGTIAALGLGLFVAGARDVRQKLQLLRHGVPTNATVVAIEQTNVSINKKPQWRIRFRYSDRFGEEREGMSGYLSATRAHAWRPGEIGRVHVDTERPDRVLWTGEPPMASS
jgi:hypothetical protein